MRHSAGFGTVLAAMCLLAACGGDRGEGAPVTVAAADPHPCDLLSVTEASEVLGAAVADVSRLEADPLNGGQASCAWTGVDEALALGLIVEGPAFFAGAPDGYRDSAEAYRFWREDTLDAGFSVIDVEGAGDAAFMPVIGPGAPNAMVMQRGEYLVHVSLLGPGSEQRMTGAVRLVAAALDRRQAPASTDP